MIYVNGIKNVIKDSSFLLYADDLTLYKSTNVAHDCKVLQYDICSVEKWCKDNY